MVGLISKLPVQIFGMFDSKSNNLLTIVCQITIIACLVKYDSH